MFNPYTPAKTKSLSRGGKPVSGSFSDFNLSDSNYGGESSFRYDPLGTPLKSTQQISVDWSKFENHTFFSSGEVKVNESFDRIINRYPFDGTRKEVETFLDSLTGFEKWVWESFPRNSGGVYLHSGGYIPVKDKSGTLYPDLSKNTTGETVINPPDGTTSLSIELLLTLPTGSNGREVVVQKLSSPENGFTLHLEPSSTSEVECIFSLSSGSFRNTVSTLLTKGVWNHVCVVHNKGDERGNLPQFYLNEELVGEGGILSMGKLDVDNSPFLIGSGSSFYSGNSLLTPTETLEGTLDELRVFHSVRELRSQILFSSRGLYSTPDLKLYFRFNEPVGYLSPGGNSSVDSIVLDSSGNSLHSNISNFTGSMRVNLGVTPTNPMRNERSEFTITLFPSHSSVLTLNSNLLSQAREYDRNNPNNIIRLIPPHYLLEGSSQDGFSSPEGDGGDPYGGVGIPGEGKMGSVQIILTFLYIWSKHFDELKMYLDSFGTLRSVGYLREGTLPDNFLEDRIREFGFYLPKMFTNVDLDSFVHGDSRDPQEDDSIPLREIQSEIMRRVLVNLPKISRSKGTQHSIKSFLRSVGIDPNNSLSIREYGGSTTKQIGTTREIRTETLPIVEFSSGSLITTPYLTSPRTEPGFPEITGTPNDSLLTSGSWNMEGLWKIPPQKLPLITESGGIQSLLRVVGTGSLSTQHQLYGNLIVTPGSDHPLTSPTVELYLRPGCGTTSPTLSLTLPLEGDGVFDGDTWSISFGCERNSPSSSYYLRAGKMEEGEIRKMYTTSSYFQEDPSGSGNVFREFSPSHNSSGSFIVMGSNHEFDYGTSGYYHLNSTLSVDSPARTTQYVGWGGNLKFYSTSLSLEEWKEHVRNPLSTGVGDPTTHWNYVTSTSGSFGRLRLDTLVKQTTRDSDSLGNIPFLDFSEGIGTSQGTGFPPSSNVLVGDILTYSHLSPKFDEVSTDEKIRVRSFTDPTLVEENPWSVLAPTYLSSEVFSSEEPQDDLRLSIEFSLMDSLDRDIVRIFSSLDPINDALGSPENMFSPDYPDLEILRDVYFNRLSSKPDWRSFLEFYRWFDLSISSFIEQLVPGKTNYKGTNFVVESHMLERHKNSYHWDGNYVGDKIRVQDELRVQLISGRIGKY